MRDISDILLFRSDISPFLAHLTRNLDHIDAKTRLRSILDNHTLQAGSSPISDVRFGGNTRNLGDDLRRFFGAICFTETPVSEVHCLLEINNRVVNLEPYGLVFVKDRLKDKGVSPAIYMNNELGDIDNIFYALFTLKDTNPAVAERLLPLVGVFGQKIRPPNTQVRPAGRIDFVWEREWRYPAALPDFTFVDEDVFCGLCPHEEIAEFEAAYEPIRFIDPRRTMKWYAKSLIRSRQRLDLPYSVV